MVRLFAWLVAKWGNARGIKDDEYSAAAQGLWTLRDKIRDFDNKKFAPTEEDRQLVGETCNKLVESMRQCGVRRKEWSWASKMLYWLQPKFFPIYDSFVRCELGINGVGKSAYKRIIDCEYHWAMSLEHQFVSGVSDVEPSALLRAIDKHIWLKHKTGRE